MSKRTVKDIEAQIKELEDEKRKLEHEEFMEKFEPIIDILSTTTLSVAQIKKLIKDAEKENLNKKANKTANNKIKNNKNETDSDVDKPTRKGYEKEHTCEKCGKVFIAKSPRQKICPECKTNNDKEENK